MTPASDWRFWVRAVISTQLVAIGGVVTLMHYVAPALTIAPFALLVRVLRHRVKVYAHGVEVRWLFFRKFIPSGAIIAVRYTPPNILKRQALEVSTRDRKIQLRARPSVLTAVGEDLRIMLGTRVDGTLGERDDEPSKAPVLVAIAVVAGVVLGFLLFRS